MKNFKSIIISLALIGFSVFAMAESFTINLKNGDQHKIEYNNRTLSGRGIELNNGQMIDYQEVKNITTDNFNAYEKATRRAKKNGAKHIKVGFIGDKNVHLQKLEQLEKRRTGAHAARAGGGILAIVGALSGDRDLYAAGMLTYGAGTIAKDINTEKTLATQTEMLNELHQNQNKQETEEEKYRREYGNENVDAIIALLEHDYERASALANAGETSKDANYRLSAMYVMAIIAVDKGDEGEAEKAYEKLVTFDPEIIDADQAKEETKIIVEELNKLRNS